MRAENGAEILKGGGRKGEAGLVGKEKVERVQVNSFCPAQTGCALT